MKQVVFITHGRSEKASAKKTDYARHLTGKGRREIIKIIKSFDQIKDFKCDRIITSVALRAFETAEVIATKTGLSKDDITINEYLYMNCTHETIKKMFNEQDNAINCLFIVGHNPSFSETINKFFPEFDIEMPPSSAFSITFKTDKWDNIYNVKPELGFYHFLKDSELSKMDRMAGKDVIVRFENGLSTLIEKTGKDITFSDTSIVRKATRKFLKRIINEVEIITISDIAEFKKIKNELDKLKKIKEEKRVQKAAEKENKAKLKLEKKLDNKKTRVITEREKLETKKGELENRIEGEKKKLEKLISKKRSLETPIENSKGSAHSARPEKSDKVKTEEPGSGGVDLAHNNAEPDVQ